MKSIQSQNLLNSKKAKLAELQKKLNQQTQQTNQNLYLGINI